MSNNKYQEPKRKLVALLGVSTRFVFDANKMSMTEISDALYAELGAKVTKVNAFFVSEGEPLRHLLPASNDDSLVIERVFNN